MDGMQGVNLAQQITIAILSGGGAAAIYTLVKAYLAVRSSADTREGHAIGHLEKWRKEADERAHRAYILLAYERSLSAYWQRRAGIVEHRLVSAGGAAPDFEDPPDPPPPPTTD